VDLHKYAYAPKGASLVFHRSPKLRSHHIFSFTKWLGYTLVNLTLQSTNVAREIGFMNVFALPVGEGSPYCSMPPFGGIGACGSPV